MEPSDYEYTELSETDREMSHFMARRMGFDHFIIAGYDSEEFNKHILSKGLYPIGAPKISAFGSLAGMVFIISRLLLDFEFSYDLRRAVMSTLNTVLTGREMRRGRERPEGD